MGNLTTLASVRRHMQITDGADTDLDAQIDALIPAASDAIMDYAQREFKTDTNGSTARKFRYDGNGVLDLAPWDLRTLSSVKIDTDIGSGTTLTSSEYRLQPVGAVHGVYHSIHLPGFAVPNTAGSSPGYREVQVTGTWGFVTIPEKVRMAANITIAFWLRSTAQHMGSFMAEDGGDTLRAPMLPTIVKGLLDSYRKRGI